jgi:hypothetical protein
MLAMVRNAKPAHSKRRGIIVVMSYGSLGATDFARLLSNFARPDCRPNKVRCSAPSLAKCRTAAPAIFTLCGSEALALAISGAARTSLKAFSAYLASLDRHWLLPSVGSNSIKLIWISKNYFQKYL